MPNICNFVECDESIRSDHYLCKPHWEQKEDSEINKCANCGQYKPSQYELCLTCKRKLSKSKASTSRAPRKTKVAESRPEYVVDAPDPRPRKDAETDVFYVYLLHLKGGKYYAGQTNDLGSRYMEHVTDKTKSTRGKNPKLAWFSRVRTREEAREYEKYLKKVCKDNERAITKMVNEFLVLIKDVHDPKKTPIA